MFSSSKHGQHTLLHQSETKGTNVQMNAARSSAWSGHSATSQPHWCDKALEAKVMPYIIGVGGHEHLTCSQPRGTDAELADNQLMSRSTTSYLVWSQITPYAR